MKYFESFVFICFFYVISKSLTNSTQSTELLNTINSIISNNNNWNTVIRQTNILIDGNPKTIISYLSENLNYDDRTSVIQLNESNVLEVLNLVYTAFKCEYASLVRDLLNIFFEYISLCESHFGVKSINTSSTTTEHNNCSYKTIITKFIDFKQNIVKMIFNLFNFMDLSQHLKLSDQTFLKSLLTINLFLCYHQQIDIDKSTTNNHYDILPTNAADMNDTYQDDHRIDRIIILKKVVVQMKNLVDHFRCKNCFVGYDYFNDSLENNNIKTSITTYHDHNTIIYDNYLNSLTSKMNNYNDISLHNDLYNVEMYDPQYLLVEKVFEIDHYFKQTMWKLYEDTRKSYDIKDISDYQNILVESFNIILYRKSEHIINMKLDIVEKKQLLNELLSSYNDNINKMIPSKLLSNSCRFLIKNMISLMTLSDSDKMYLSEEAKLLELLNDAVPTQSKDFKDHFNNLSIADLIKNISESTHFKSFRQTFELFERELDTNEDYKLLTMDVHEKLEKQLDGSQDMNTSLCKATTVLRQILALISRVIEVMEKYDMCTKGDDITVKEDCFQDNLRFHLNSVFSYIEDLIEKTIDSQLHQMLFPILFHLENMGWVYRGENDDEAFTQYVTIYQYVLMTLGLIERYELRNCKSPKYNQTIYDEIAVYANIKSIPDGKSSDMLSAAADVVVKLKTQIAFITIKYNNYTHQISMHGYIDNHMFKEFLSHHNPRIYSKNYQFYWYGYKTNVYNIVRGITQNVIDYHDILRYQLILMQWFISTIYIKINCLLKCPLSELKINLIKQKLSEIGSELNYPETVKNDFEDTVKMYFDILKFKISEVSETIEMPETAEMYNNFYNYIKKKLELFDFTAIEAELSEENCCLGSLKKYFEITKITMLMININLF
uniref:Uncharacterized protein n=2 Tax=Schizaphis graminum TaxID=13262 RepID=A0A2S2NND3_SCHGA